MRGVGRGGVDERKLPGSAGCRGKLALCSQGDAFIHFGCAARSQSHRFPALDSAVEGNQLITQLVY